ncbi:hypothetical protein ColTof3_03403 [Colletotrichum tofieldiae]|nr:hypothetical protein ColTof3_03403 [Colletotrichum tofieldiae]
MTTAPGQQKAHPWTQPEPGQDTVAYQTSGGEAQEARKKQLADAAAGPVDQAHRQIKSPSNASARGGFSAR